MKNNIFTIISISIFIFTVIFSSCNKPNIGYLEVDAASFEPDSLEIRSLDPSNNNDKSRLDNNIPWVSYRIQGVMGTYPILYKIDEITSKTGNDISEITKLARVRGDGAIEIPLDNNIANGEYSIFIRATNEGYSKRIESPLHIIVNK
ncbi:MAG: hypothetical protein N4A49_01965 [Marinifilaceae bacterium]|nr:hypothetical protein [Marinifilaceae bacterium]